MNAEAQANIGKAVQGLINDGHVDLIALEGAFAPIDLTPFRAFPQESTRKVANYLFRENKISGPIYAAFTSPKPIPSIVGIDDPVHYNANVDAYRSSISKADEYKSQLNSLKNRLASEKKKLFNPLLYNFDLQVQGYRDGHLSLGSYVEFLSRQTSEFSPTIETFIEAFRLESSLNFAAVEAERGQLLSELLAKLNASKSQTLVAASVAYRLGHISHVDFYTRLKTLCAENGIFLSRFPAMTSYLQYVLLTDRIDAENLFRDLKKMESKAYASLTRTQDEKQLIAESEKLSLTGKLLDFALTKDEWESYKEIKRENRSLDLTSFESFYHEAEARDRAMSDNLLKAMDEANAEVAVLVTGGFHSSGIGRLIQKAGITTISFSPKITKVDSENGSAYLSVFAQEKTPLDQLFEGEKLFLAKSPIPQNSQATPALYDLEAKSGGREGEVATDYPKGTLRGWFDRAGEFVRVRYERQNEILFPWITEHWKVLSWPWIIRTHKPKDAAEWWELAFDYGLLLLFTYGFGALLSIPLVDLVSHNWAVAIASILLAVFPAHLLVNTVAVLLRIRTLTGPPNPKQDRSAILKATTETNWDLKAVGRLIGRGNAAGLQAFRQAGAEDVFATEIRRRLDNSNWNAKKVANEFNVAESALREWMIALGIQINLVGREKLLEAANRLNWHWPSIRKKLNLRDNTPIINFFESNDAIENLVEKAREVMAHEKWTIKRLAERLEISEGTAHRLVRRYGLARGKINKEHVLEILTQHDWNLSVVARELNLTYGTNYLEFFSDHDLLAELKAVLLTRLTSHQWRNKPVTDAFGVSEPNIFKWMESLEISRPAVSREETLALLKERDWQFGNLKAELGLRSNDDYYDYFASKDLLPELKGQLQIALDQTGWQYQTTARRFGLRPKAIKILAKKLALTPSKESNKETMLKILTEHSWNLKAAAAALRMKHSDDRLKFLTQRGLRNEFQEILLQRLNDNSWVILRVAKLFGLPNDVVTKWVGILGLERPQELINRSNMPTLVEKTFDDFHGWVQNDPALFQNLALRYGLDLRNIMWGLISEQLHGSYDEALLGRLVDEKILEALDESISNAKGTEAGTRIITGAPEESGGSAGRPKVFDPATMNQDDIERIAKGLEDRLAKQSIAQSLEDATRRSAVLFLYKLEQRLIFNRTFSEHPTASAGSAALAEIAHLKERETASILREVLDALETDVVEALKLQDRLHEKGLAKSTYLNLYQLIGVQRILESKRIILGDEMGLGKTLEVLCAFLLADDATEMLVVAPKLALTRWLEDIRDHIALPLELVMLSSDIAVQGLKAIERTGAAERNDFLLKPRGPPGEGKTKRVILMNYDLLPSLARARESVSGAKASTKVDFLALDEAHLLKNTSADRSEAVWGIDDEVPIQSHYEVFATGTPLENQVRDPMVFLKAIARHGDTEVDRIFAEQDMRALSRTFAASNLTRMSQFHHYLISRMVRRLKRDVVRGLPPKKIVEVRLDLAKGTMQEDTGAEIKLPGHYASQGTLYDLALNEPEEFERVFGNRASVNGELDEDIRKAQRAVQIVRLQQAANGPGLFAEPGDSIKFDAAKVLADRAVHAGRSVLIFSESKTTTRLLADHLRQFDPYRGTAVLNIDGDVAASARSERLAAFQNKASPVLIATTGTMSLSVQATQASVIIFIDDPWKPSTEEQAISRVHRFDSEGRHIPGKEIEIYRLRVQHPTFSIDEARARVSNRKRILTEMDIEGYLTPDILAAFRDTDRAIPRALEEHEETDTDLNSFELTLHQQFRLLIGKIFASPSADQRLQLWNEAAHLYLQILEYKGSFFANMANLDFLSGDAFPEFKNKELNVLDVASGPSTLYRAWLKKRSGLTGQSFGPVNIKDYELSPDMLALGVSRPGDQILGSMDRLAEAFDENKFDIVNLAYAFHYAAHPAKLLMTIHRILRAGGVFTLVLPPTNILPPRFYEALKKLGFRVRVGPDAKLTSRLDEASYAQFLREYGKEFADDIAKQSRGTFTYLVAEKDPHKKPEEVSDEDVRILRHVPPMDGEKVGKLKESSRDTKYKLLPEDGEVKGDVIFEEAPEPLEKVTGKGHRAKITRTVNRVNRLAQQLVMTKETDARSRGRRARLEEDLNAVFAECLEYIRSQTDAFSKEDLEHGLSKLGHLNERNYSRQWFRLHASELADLQLELQERLDQISESGETPSLLANLFSSTWARRYRLTSLNWVVRIIFVGGIVPHDAGHLWAGPNKGKRLDHGVGRILLGLFTGNMPWITRGPPAKFGIYGNLFVGALSALVLIPAAVFFPDSPARLIALIVSAYLLSSNMAVLIGEYFLTPVAEKWGITKHADLIQAKRPADLLNMIIGQAINKNIGQKFSSQDAFKKATPEELEALVRALAAALRNQPVDIHPEEMQDLAEAFGTVQGRPIAREQILREKLQILARGDDRASVKKHLAKKTSQQMNLIVDLENNALYTKMVRNLGLDPTQVRVRSTPNLFVASHLNQDSFEEVLVSMGKEEIRSSIFVLPQALVSELSSFKGLPGSLLYRVNYIALEDLLSNMPEVQVRNLGLVIGIARIVSIGA